MDELDVREHLDARYDMGFNFVLGILFIKESEPTTTDELLIDRLVEHSDEDADRS